MNNLEGLLYVMYYLSYPYLNRIIVNDQKILNLMKNELKTD